VLVDRRTDPPKQVWPVRYATMFHMTNDSHLFKRRDELDAEGFYPVGGNVWRKGNEAYSAPLQVVEFLKSNFILLKSNNSLKNNEKYFYRYWHCRKYLIHKS